MRYSVGLLLLAARLALGEDDYTYPSTRYTLYSGLGSTKTIAARRLEYTEDSWNNPGTNLIEWLSFSTITANNPSLVGSFSTLDMTEDQWDCYVNHYEDYDWEELEEYSIDTYFATLGYTSSMWENDDSAETDELSWNELSDEERAAAEELCWFQDLWDEEPMSDWGSAGGATGGSPAEINWEEYSCFAGTNIVHVLGKGPVYMEDLRVGDQVLGGNNKHSKVYSMSHVDRNAEMEYIQLHSSKSRIPLEVSNDHFVFLNSNQVKRAADVKIGDTLQNDAVVTDIQTVKRRGLYAPLTMSGELLVSGDFLASSFVSMSDAIPAAVQHYSAHTLMAPLRWVCSASFEVCKNESHTQGRSDFVWAGIQTLWKVTAFPAAVQHALYTTALPLLATLWLLDNMTKYFLVSIASLPAVWYFLQKKSQIRRWRS